MTLWKNLARLMLEPSALNAAKSQANVASDLSCTGPLIDGASFSLSEATLHHKQQCFPVRMDV